MSASSIQAQKSVRFHASDRQFTLDGMDEYYINKPEHTEIAYKEIKLPHITQKKNSMEELLHLKRRTSDKTKKRENAARSDYSRNLK